jgi:hypothetical protein
MRLPLFVSFLLSAGAFADGEGELPFTFRPNTLLASGNLILDVAAASDFEQSFVAFVEGPGNLLQVVSADGRGLGVPESQGGWSANPILLASGSPIQLDLEGARAAGNLGVIAWIQDSGPAGTGQVRFARRSAPSAPWVSGLSIPTLPAGDATALEVALSRDAVSKLYVGALIDGSLRLTSSPNGGLSFGPSQSGSASNAAVQAFDLEGQSGRVALVYIDQRGPDGASAVWSRTGLFDGLTNTLALGPEVQLFAKPGIQATRPEIALEGDLVSVGFLADEQSGGQRLWVAHSGDFGANWFLASKVPSTTQLFVSIDGVLSFDLEITDDRTQVAVEETLGGVSTIGRGITFGPANEFDWSVFSVDQGTDPLFPRVEGSELSGNPPGSITLYYNRATEVPGGTTLGLISADQEDGCEYHDDIYLLGPESGVEPSQQLVRFAAAYNDRYDNHIAPFVMNTNPQTLLVSGYRALAMATEDLVPGLPGWKFRFGHVPFTDSLLFVALSLSEGAGSLLLPDARESGIQLDALTQLGFSEPIFSTFLLAPNDPTAEGAELAPIPIAYPIGLPIYAVGVSIDPVIGFNKITDVLELP